MFQRKPYKVKERGKKQPPCSRFVNLKDKISSGKHKRSLQHLNIITVYFQRIPSNIFLLTSVLGIAVCAELFSVELTQEVSTTGASKSSPGWGKICTYWFNHWKICGLPSRSDVVCWLQQGILMWIHAEFNSRRHSHFLPLADMIEPRVFFWMCFLCCLSQFIFLSSQTGHLLTQISWR